MVQAPAKYIKKILSQLSDKLDRVTVTEHDENPERVMLNISACYGDYDIRISEIEDAKGRKYAYYAIIRVAFYSLFNFGFMAFQSPSGHHQENWKPRQYP